MTDTTERSDPNLSYPESTDDKPEKKGFSHKQKVGIVMAGVALTLVAAIGIGSNVNALNQSRQTTKTEAPANPKQTTTVATETAPTTPEVNIDQYDKSMEQYRNMSVDAFEKLPRNDRLKYAMYLVDQTTIRGNYDKIYEYADNYVKYTPVSKQNSGQEIVNNNIFIRQNASIQFVEADVSGQPRQPFDSIDGQKVLSAAFYQVGKDKLVSNEYLNLKAIFEPMQKPSPIIDKNTVLKTTPLLQKEIADAGEKVQYKIITYQRETGETYYARYIYQTFTGYDGSQQATWLMDASSDSLNELSQTGF